MPTRPRPLPAWLLFTAGAALAAAAVAFSRYHDGQNADALIPVMVSLYQWEPFYWGQNRLGMVLPAVAAPFPHPLANLLVQNGLSIFGALAAVGVVAWYLLRDRTAAAVGGAGAALFLLAFPVRDRFHVLNGAQPYQIPLGLALGGVIVAAGNRRLPLRAGVAVALTAVAYWYNSGLGLLVAPLAALRFVAARFLGPDAPSAAPPARGWVDRIRRVPGGREFIIAAALTALGTGFGRWLMTLSTGHQTDLSFTPSAEWPAAWEWMADGVRNRFRDYLVAVGVAAAVGAGWLASPRTRPAAARGFVVFGIAAAWLAAQVLVFGTMEWVKMNGYDIRYAFAGLAALAPAAAAVLVGPAVAAFPGVARRAGWAVAVGLPLAAVGAYGVPSVGAARAALDRSTGRWTADVLASGCTHVVGEYWVVWPATFHANMTLADAGDPRVVWGVSERSGSTHPLWSRPTPGGHRLGWVMWPGQADPTAASDGAWRWAFPETVAVERRPTLVVHVPRDPAPAPEHSRGRR